MEQDGVRRPSHVIGPDGHPMSLVDLPPADTKRWVIRRKAQVIAAVRGGLITLEEACDRYNLSVEEFLSWQRMIEKHGLPGLRVTRIQEYRGRDGDGHAADFADAEKDAYSSHMTPRLVNA